MSWRPRPAWSNRQSTQAERVRPDTILHLWPPHGSGDWESWSCPRRIGPTAVVPHPLRSKAYAAKFRTATCRTPDRDRTISWNSGACWGASMRMAQRR